MAENVTFRFAEREDVPLILEFVKALAEYEKMPDAVCATEEDLEEWLFDKERAEEAKQRAEGRLTERSANIDLDRAQTALMRAIARINAVALK